MLRPFVDEAALHRMWVEFEERYEQRLLPSDRAPQFVVARVEAVLAAMIGATSAHQAMEQLEQSQQLAFTDLAGMVSDASRLNTFNRELLETTVENLTQGVAVVDHRADEGYVTPRACAAAPGHFAPDCGHSSPR